MLALEGIADDEQQAPQFNAVQHIPGREHHHVLSCRFAHHGHRTGEQRDWHGEGKQTGHCYCSAMSSQPIQEPLGDRHRPFQIKT